MSVQVGVCCQMNNKQILFSFLNSVKIWALMSFLGGRGTTPGHRPCRPHKCPGWRGSELLNHSLVYGRSTLQPQEDLEFSEEWLMRNRPPELTYLC